VRHFSLFTPRDFDISPYFRVIKPEVECGFDYRTILWSEDGLIGPVAAGMADSDRNFPLGHKEAIRSSRVQSPAAAAGFGPEYAHFPPFG
jgi:hypothetical protein